MSIHIEGRRWFQRTYGNIYHTVRIYKDGEQIASLPEELGYGDRYLQRAFAWLADNGYPDLKGRSVCATLYLRETLHGTHSVIDVQRERDL